MKQNFITPEQYMIQNEMEDMSIITYQITEDGQSIYDFEFVDCQNSGPPNFCDFEYYYHSGYSSRFYAGNQFWMTVETFIKTLQQIKHECQKERVER